jgi:putative SOS response-associated peptidase YedK
MEPMCNLYEHYLAWDDYARLMQGQALGIASDPLELPFGLIHPSEVSPVFTDGGSGVRLDLMTWGWVPTGGKGLVINVRSETRRDPPSARGLTIPSAYYEYSGDKAPKSQWKFTPASNDPLAFAVLLKGGRFSLMTCDPGEDVRPHHDRQPVLISRSDWRRWLSDPGWPGDVLHASPAGSLRVEQTR